MAKRFITPFAEIGDRAAVSDTPTGTDVNYQTGYPAEYEADPIIDPAAKFVERDKNNQIYNDITANIKEWQEHVYPSFIEAVDNGGVAFPYKKGSIVTYLNVDYFSTEDNNLTSPPSSTWLTYSISTYLIFKNVDLMVNHIHHAEDNQYSTGHTIWRVNAIGGLPLAGGLFALPLNELSIVDFGAVGDGVTDDAPAIRDCINTAFIMRPEGNFTIYSPRALEYYSIQTEDPLNAGNAITIDRSLGGEFVANVSIIGEGWGSRWELETAANINNFVEINKRLTGFRHQQWYLDSKSKANITFLAQAEVCPLMTGSQSTFSNAIETNVQVDTFVSTWDMCNTSGGLKGFNFNSLGVGPVTSITLNSCYANGVLDVGFHFGFGTYCTLNACAADGGSISGGTGLGVGYLFDAAYGFTLNSCGAERAYQFMKFSAYRGVVINAPYSTGIGRDITVEPAEPYVFEFVSGTNATISGIDLRNSDPNVQFVYKLGVTGNSFGSENVTVTDRSILRGEYFSISNFSFERPVKLLRGDETSKAESITISSNTDLFEITNLIYNQYIVNHNIIIQLSDGTYDLSSIPIIFNRLSGAGSVTLQGNLGNNSAVILQTDFYRLQATDCMCKIIIKDLTLSATSGNNSFGRSSFLNCQDVVFDNVNINRDSLNAESAIRALSGSKVTLINGTATDSIGWSGSMYQEDGSSSILIEKGSTPPVSGGWDAGMRFFYDQSNTTSIAAIVTTSGANGTQVWTDV